MNAVIEAYGGIRWQSSRDAIRFIQTSKQCSESEAVEALRVWVNDNRIGARNLETGKILVGPVMVSPSQYLVAKLTSGDFLDFFEIDAVDLRMLLTSPMVFGSQRRKGAPDKYDWASVKSVLVEACQYWSGVPRPDHPDSAWRSQAQAIRAVREKMEKEWIDGGPADSTLKTQVGRMLAKIAAQMANK